jgi:hypothetical protein
LWLQTASGQLVRNTPNEELLWSYTVQLAAILRAAHATGLALRPAALTATKVRLHLSTQSAADSAMLLQGLGTWKSFSDKVVLHWHCV